MDTSQRTQCSSCKFIEVLKVQGCIESCHADSTHEKTLVAEKILKDAALPHFIQKKVPHKAVQKEFQELKRMSVSSLNSETYKNKLTCLEEKMNRLEDVLNTRAFEIYDIQELVSDNQLHEITQELNSINQRLQNLKWKKTSEYEIALKSTGRVKRDIENDKLALYHKSKALSRFVSRYINNFKERSAKVESENIKMKEILDDVCRIKDDVSVLRTVSAEELGQTMRKMLETYYHMKKCQELTKKYILDSSKNHSQYKTVQERIASLN